MKRGITLLEVLISILIFSISSMIIIIQIVNINSLKKELYNYRIEEEEIDSFIYKFERLIEDYDDNTWILNKNEIKVNDALILYINNGNYYFNYADGEIIKHQYKKDYHIKIKNENLIEISVNLSTYLFQKYFYIGGFVYES